MDYFLLLSTLLQVTLCRWQRFGLHLLRVFRSVLLFIHLHHILNLQLCFVLYLATAEPQK